MSSIHVCNAHHPVPAFDGDAIAQYMRTDFITLPDHLSVHEAREFFVSQLTSDDIPGQVFVVAENSCAGFYPSRNFYRQATRRNLSTP